MVKFEEFITTKILESRLLCIRTIVSFPRGASRLTIIILQRLNVHLTQRFRVNIRPTRFRSCVKGVFSKYLPPIQDSNLGVSDKVSSLKRTDVTVTDVCPYKTTVFPIIFEVICLYLLIE